MCKPQLVCILRFIYAETNIFCDSSSARPDIERDVALFSSQFFAISLLLYIEAPTRIFILCEHILIAFSNVSTSRPLSVYADMNFNRTNQETPEEWHRRT